MNLIDVGDDHGNDDASGGPAERGWHDLVTTLEDPKLDGRVTRRLEVYEPVTIEVD
jgi:hypothetical protein